MIIKSKLFYIMDTMCGWCYGFTEVINKTYEAFKSEFDFNLVPGGLWIGVEVKTVDESLARSIRSYNENISELTGARFGEAFDKNILQNNGFILDSMPGAKAIVTFNILKKDYALLYLKKIQEAFFFNGLNTNDWNLYADLAVGFGLSKNLFKEKYDSKETMKLTVENFTFSQKLGVSGFPSIVVKKNNDTFFVSQGIVSFENLQNNLAEFI